MRDGRRTDTRDRILDAALDLMSGCGYDGVSVRDIADAVGIKGASLYKHFEGTREVFDALIAREIAALENTLRELGANATLDDSPEAYASDDMPELEELVWRSYLPFFCDERIRKLRRMLEVSRYADERCATLYRTVFAERPLALQERIFGRLVEKGAFNQCDVALAARQFHGPMLMLMNLETKPDEARKFCIRHVRAFNELHRGGTL